MNSRRFQQDFKHGILTVGNEELVLNRTSEEMVSIERSEVILAVCLDGNVMNRETNKHNADEGHAIAIGKALLHIKRL